MKLYKIIKILISNLNIKILFINFSIIKTIKILIIK